MRAIVLSFALLLGGIASAQTTNPSSSPPMYLPLNPNAQDGGEAFGYEAHRLRHWQLAVQVPVAIEDISKLLPIGYTASAPAFINIIWVVQERTRVTAEGAAALGLTAGTYGPADAVIFLAPAIRTFDDGRTEFQFVVLEQLRPTQESADLDNAIFGPGSAWPADRLKIEIETEAPDLLLNVRARAARGNLQIQFEGTNIPADRWASGPAVVGGPFQQLDTSAGATARPTPNRKVRTAARVDSMGVPAAYWKVTLPANELRFALGTVRVTGGPLGGAIGRLHELLQKFK